MKFRTEEQMDPQTVKLVLESYCNEMHVAHNLRVENERLRGLIKMMHPDIDIDKFIHKQEDGNLEW